MRAIGKDHPRSRGVYPGPLLGVDISNWIIPARAGFTGPAAPVRVLCPDHPRSRGVYLPGLPGRAYWDGSSPLARGLPATRSGGSGGGGIIPARAGFTAISRPPSAPSRDHPRSRGVYAPSRPSGTGFRGSSPLARGLRTAAEAPATVRGIIPARAGFTGPAIAGMPGMRDHPRSRGVYAAPDLEPVIRPGSSPLARGLPRASGPLDGDRRIIPARAGFTSPTTVVTGTPRDHPRSRGVYSSGVTRAATTAGSSPLARGLRMRTSTTPTTTGIIPARAGFTRDIGRGNSGVEDHPRSRGVYSHPAITFPVSGGSSPLARGLPGHGHSRVGDDRIIPARAGFTRPRDQDGHVLRDHPRSRGVYFGLSCDRWQDGGSSPLARGLRRRSPRPSSGRPGSSPLARGLPVAGAPREIIGRIIPARAGFTRCATCSSTT